MGDISDSIFMKKLSPLNGIYIVYTVLSRGICNNIPPQPRHFFVLGLRPRTKKCLGFGGILLHIPLESTVYTLHIYIYIIYIDIIICNGYTVCLRTISNSIVPKPRHFFVRGRRPRTKKCRG